MKNKDAAAISVAIAALCVNAALCIIYAEVPDTFIISNSIISAAFILTLKGDING